MPHNVRIMANKPRTHTLFDDLAPLKSNLKDLQLLLNISKTGATKLVNDGVLKKDDRGEYDLLICLKNYISYLQQKGGTSRGVGADYHEERARLTKAQADKAELDAALLSGEMVMSQDVLSEWESMLASMKAKLLSMPSKLAPMVADEDEPGIVQDMIDDHMREALEELASYGAGKRSTSTDEGDEGSDAPAKADRKPVGRPRKTTRRTVKQ